MNPKTYHSRLVKGNGVKKYVAERRINKETMRVKMAYAKFIPNPRLLISNENGVREYLVALTPLNQISK